MARFKLTVAYDGTGFVGWQRQADGISIQGLLEDALGPLENRAVTVAGAGRTDAGVHAEGQVAAVTLERPIEPEALARAVNARLPPAVRVLDAEVVPDAFHPRFDAAAKSYRYRIFAGPVLSPFAVRYAWHVPGPLDVEAMGRAARALSGEHDFSAFRSVGTVTESAVRVLYESAVIGGGRWLDGTRRSADASRADRKARSAEASRDRADAWVTYNVRGSGFLRHMVRAIVGSLVEIGRGRRRADWLLEVLASRDRTLAGPTAPPQGLCLVRVEYPTLAARL